MTRARSVTCSISSSFGTLPNSFWSATATLALRSFFFCSGVMLLMILKYQNSQSLPSYGTLILERLLEHYAMRKLQDFGGFPKCTENERFRYRSHRTS